MWGWDLFFETTIMRVPLFKVLHNKSCIKMRGDMRCVIFHDIPHVFGSETSLFKDSCWTTWGKLWPTKKLILVDQPMEKRKSLKQTSHQQPLIFSSLGPVISKRFPLQWLEKNKENDETLGTTGSKNQLQGLWFKQKSSRLPGSWSNTDQFDMLKYIPL